MSEKKNRVTEVAIVLAGATGTGRAIGKNSTLSMTLHALTKRFHGQYNDWEIYTVSSMQATSQWQPKITQ